jgi:DNA modification methylase
MPMNITARAIGLWSNEGDVVWSPFTGIGSEGVVALRMARRFIGTELNGNYYQSAVGHITAAAKEGIQASLFDVVDAV